MSKTKQNINLFQKYKHTNIARFVFEIIFIISLMLTYTAMITSFLRSAGPCFLLLTIAFFLASIILEIKRLILYLKLKKEKEGSL